MRHLAADGLHLHRLRGPSEGVTLCPLRAYRRPSVGVGLAIPKTNRAQIVEIRHIPWCLSLSGRVKVQGAMVGGAVLLFDCLALELD